MVNYIAGIIAVPTELIEAAKIDGANKFQAFRRVTLPLIMPAVSIWSQNKFPDQTDRSQTDDVRYIVKRTSYTGTLLFFRVLFSTDVPFLMNLYYSVFEWNGISKEIMLYLAEEVTGKRELPGFSKNVIYDDEFAFKSDLSNVKEAKEVLRKLQSFAIPAVYGHGSVADGPDRHRPLRKRQEKICFLVAGLFLLQDLIHAFQCKQRVQLLQLVLPDAPAPAGADQCGAV